MRVTIPVADSRDIGKKRCGQVRSQRFCCIRLFAVHCGIVEVVTAAEVFHAREAVCR